MLPLLGLLYCVAVSYAQDPANGWLGYATGKNPNGGNDPITFIEAYWTNLKEPENKNCFYSPWFGIESSDNLNLIQPVNPWTGRQWEIYNEYFQWFVFHYQFDRIMQYTSITNRRPTHNENSKSHVVYPGDLIYGSVTFDEARQEYKMYHADLTKGHEWSVNTTIAVQKEGVLFSIYTQIRITYQQHFNLHRRSTRSIQ